MTTKVKVDTMRMAYFAVVPFGFGRGETEAAALRKARSYGRPGECIVYRRDCACPEHVPWIDDFGCVSYCTLPGHSLTVVRDDGKPERVGETLARKEA